MLKNNIFRFFSLFFLLFSFSSAIFGEVVSLGSSDLLKPGNFDLMAKYIYAQYQKKGVQSDWHHEMYAKHIAAMNPDLYGQELDDVVQRSLDVFNDALIAFQNGDQESLPPVKLAPDYTILEGRELAAACLFFNKPVICEICQEAESVIVDYVLLTENNLRRDFLDAMGREYCRMNKKCLLSVVWPRGVPYVDEMKEVWCEIGDIAYEKPFIVKNNAPGFMLRNAPYGAKRADWKKILPSYFPNNLGPEFKVIVLILEVDNKSVAEVKRQKGKMRAVARAGTASIHIDDFHKESYLTSRTFMSDPAIHYMNHSKGNGFKNFNNLFNQYKIFATASKSPEDFCIDNGSVLASYGLRDVGDLDYLYHGHVDYIKKHSPKKIEGHNWVFNHYKRLNADDVIYNPNYHFYYKNFKMESLEVIRDIKATRPGDKNAKDVQCIDRLLASM